MSVRYVIKDIEDIEISDDGKELEVLFDDDDFGNKYVDIPIEMIVNRLEKLVMPKIAEDEKTILKALLIDKMVSFNMELSNNKYLGDIERKNMNNDILKMNEILNKIG